MHPKQVRALLFNDAFNVYEWDTDSFIFSFPVKGSTTNLVGKTFYVYSPDQKIYLQYEASDPSVNEITKQVEYANKNLFARLIKHRAFTLFFSMIALIAGLYFGIISLVPYLGSKLIDKETEISIGKNLQAAMVQQEIAMGATIDTAGTKELQAFVNRLKLGDYPLNITLVKSRIVNAYALPGGEIVIYTGILNKMNSYETLVALLAHECTHVNERHSLKSLLRSAANGIVISVLFSDPTGISAVIAGNAENLNGLRYSRSLETEADTKGMGLMIVNNVDLKGMKQLMEVLKKEGDMPGELAFLSTHPLTEERIKHADAFINSNKTRPSIREDLQGIFKALKDREKSW